jgi:IS5 family transposase
MPTTVPAAAIRALLKDGGEIALLIGCDNLGSARGCACLGTVTIVT